MEQTKLTSILSPRKADEKIIDGEGGSYYSWSSSNYPILGDANVGGGKLLLQPRGFALPHYADSSKIGYVLQGTCTVGILSPNASEAIVLTIKEGDEIPVPLGGVSWWFNGGNIDLIISFIGETSKAYIPGEFTYFILAGPIGSMKGFSNEFIAKAYGVDDEEAEKLVTAQANPLIMKLEDNIEIPLGKNEEETLALISNLADQVELSANLVKLESNGVGPATCAVDGSVKLIYVVKGSGRVQIVGTNGERVVDAEVEVGDLIVVPRFYTVMEVAGEEGLQYIYVVTSDRPVFQNLSGDRSVWKGLGLKIIEASLGVTSELAEKLILKN